MNTITKECKQVISSASDYLDGHITDANHRLLTEHLDHCKKCRQTVDELERTVQLLGHLTSRQATRESEKLAARTFKESLAAPQSKLSPAKPRAVDSELWQDLEAVPRPHRTALIREDARMHSPSFCRWVGSASRRSAVDDPVHALDLAQVALEIAQSLPPNSERSDLLSECWAAEAGSRLHLSDFTGASRGLALSERYFSEGSQSKVTRARLMMVKALLWSALGRCEEAALMFMECVDLFTALDDTHSMICMNLNASGAWLRSGKPLQALEILEETKGTLDGIEAPRRSYVCLINLAFAYCEVGRPGEAESLLSRITDLAVKLGSQRSVTVKSIRGCIHLAREEWSAALGCFGEARSYYAQSGEWLHYVESSLDMARVYLGRQDWVSLAELIEKTKAAASEMRAELKCLEALSLLENAIASRTLRVARLRSVAVLLQSSVGRMVEIDLG